MSYIFAISQSWSCCVTPEMLIFLAQSSSNSPLSSCLALFSTAFREADIFRAFMRSVLYFPLSPSNFVQENKLISFQFDTLDSKAVTQNPLTVDLS